MVSTYLQCFIVIKQKMVLGNLKYNEKFGCNITCWNLLHKNTWASNCKCGGIQRSAAKNHTILHQNTINLHEWPNNSCRVKYELLQWMFRSKEQRKSVVKVESVGECFGVYSRTGPITPFFYHIRYSFCVVYLFIILCKLIWALTQMTFDFGGIV